MNDVLNGHTLGIDDEPEMNPADTPAAHLHPNPGPEEVDELLSERCHLCSFIFFYSIIDCEGASKTLFPWLESVRVRAREREHGLREEDCSQTHILKQHQYTHKHASRLLPPVFVISPAKSVRCKNFSCLLFFFFKKNAC